VSDSVIPPGRIDLTLGQLDDGVTTDDDMSEAPSLTLAQAKRYEQQVGRILAGRSEQANRSENTHLPGKVSGSQRQIDVLFTTRPLPDVEMHIVVECKHYKRRIGVGVIDELIGKVSDVGAVLGILCAANGFSGPARQRAANSVVPKITLMDLTGDEDLVVNIAAIEEEYVARFDCPGLNCEWGEVSWGQMVSESGATIAVGTCDKCGTLAIKCEDCDETEQEGFDFECSCEYAFSTVCDRRGEFDGVVRTDRSGNEVSFDRWV